MFCLLLFFFARTAHAVLTIEITEGVEGSLPIAVVPFEWQGNGIAPPVNVSEVVAADLKRSGRFNVLPEQDLVARPNTRDQVNFRDWRMLNQDNLLIGRVTSTKDGYVVDYYLFNVFKGVELLAYRTPPAEPGLLRATAHEIANTVYEALIGQRGAFNTRIAYIVVERDAKNKTHHSLIVADADGYNPREILSSPTEILSPAWSPDGTRIAYTRFEKDHFVLYVQDVATGTREVVSSSPGHNGAPAWSPDGKKLALVLQKRRVTDNSNFDVYILDLQSKALTRFTDHWAIETYPAWSPDGKYIVFTSDRAQRPQLYRKPVAGGKEERITFEGAENDRGVFSPDGKMLAMVHGNGGEYRIAVMELATGQLRPLTEGKLDESPSFAPNGSMILYARTKRTGEQVLSTVSIDGRFDFPLSERGRSIREPAWSPF
jgi:TolB protein